jgi:uncharacterized damage-inducible protein DinB
VAGAAALAAVLALAPPMSAQEGSAEKGDAKMEMQEGAAEAPGAGFKTDTLADFERVSGKLLSLAEAIPADQYGWRPSEEVRTVAQVLMHVAVTNYALPPGFGATPAAGVPQGFQELSAELEAVTAKDQVLEKLRASIDYAKAALAGVPDAEVSGTVEFFGRDMSRRQLMLILLTHAHEHLGQAIAYARSIGVVPPWSRGGE